MAQRSANTIPYHTHPFYSDLALYTWFVISDNRSRPSSWPFDPLDQARVQQRIVTQLKRNLRHAKSAKTQPPAEQDYEEELNFALQTPMVPIRKVSV